ncbi:hypothetical protein [Microcystis panniformis]|nr:hypothetical protein [Microcystis panniformis]
METLPLSADRQRAIVARLDRTSVLVKLPNDTLTPWRFSGK